MRLFDRRQNRRLTGPRDTLVVVTEEEPEDLKLAYCLYGLQQATLRFDQAHWHRNEDAFVSVAEAVSWAVALDAVLEDATHAGRDGREYKRVRGSCDDGKTVIGMKFVRNHVHHAAEMLSWVYVNALVGNSAHGLRNFWLWTDLDNLDPKPSDQFTSGRGLYASRIGGHSVLDTLLDANRFFLSLVPALPPLPPSEVGEVRVPFILPERWPPIDNDRRA